MILKANPLLTYSTYYFLESHSLVVSAILKICKKYVLAVGALLLASQGKCPNVLARGGLEASSPPLHGRKRRQVEVACETCSGNSVSICSSYNYTDFDQEEKQFNGSVNKGWSANIWWHHQVPVSSLCHPPHVTRVYLHGVTCRLPFFVLYAGHHLYPCVCMTCSTFIQWWTLHKRCILQLHRSGTKY